MIIIDPNIITEVKHSQSKPAWNIVGCKLGGKYKIARVPYVITSDSEVNDKNKNEALIHANFINWCLNNSNNILKNMKKENGFLTESESIEWVKRNIPVAIEKHDGSKYISPFSSKKALKMVYTILGERLYNYLNKENGKK